MRCGARRGSLFLCPGSRRPRDPYLKTEASTAAKGADKELSRIQTFVLDGMAPLTAALEAEGTHIRSGDPINSHFSPGANGECISQLQREKITAFFNKSLLPLAQEDKDFTEAAPHLFGLEFAKWSKEHLDQVKALRTSMSSQHDKPFFQGVPQQPGELQSQRREGQHVKCLKRLGQDRPKCCPETKDKTHVQT